MPHITLDRTQFRDKVHACWIGKNIGGTLGGPWEGRKHTHALTFYEPVPDKALPNDDLDLQIVWLKMLEDEGIDPSVRTFAEYWWQYASAYPWDEYGFFVRNFARGLRPPVAGCFENFFVDNMGSPIRSEIWACLHPGDPQAAARMAWKDAALDHAGGEGTCGEMFWAAVQSAAFVERDPMTLIRIGLHMIPLASHVGRAIREAVLCWQKGLTWGQARDRIVTWFGTQHPCHAVPNHAFTIIGWLYGDDFGDRLCKAVNCGFDTDCTGATLGALLGILEGTGGIPPRWRKPVGDQIVLHKFTGQFNSPRTLSEFTDRTVALSEQAAVGGDVMFSDRTTLPDDLLTRLVRNEQARQALAQDNHAGVELLADGREVWLHYNGEPVMHAKVERELDVTVDGRAAAQAELTVPDGWSCRSLGEGKFAVCCKGPVAPRSTLTVVLPDGQADFTMLGPDEAKGYPAGENIPKCSECGGRLNACVCP
ncbi:MAG TPA: ADP-ribosylglycohydrolase family protein [Phycisphaerae bacterium]|nr:ADP-ribosylglycohydrolase family protein [Phycisphaerae bacterium]